MIVNKPVQEVQAGDVVLLDNGLTGYVESVYPHPSKAKTFVVQMRGNTRRAYGAKETVPVEECGV